MNLIMNAKISVVLLLLLGCSLRRVNSEETTASTTTLAPTTESSSTESESTSTPAPIFSCSLYEGMTVDLKALSGSWYETARAPNTESTQCMKISLADSPNADNKVSVELDYVETAGDKWDHDKDSHLFPWNDETKKGIFTWLNDDKKTVFLKLLDTDNTSFALFCGYTETETAPAFKILTRQRELNAQEKTDVQKRFDDFHKGTELAWVEQNVQKCNSAMRSAGGALVALALALLIFQRN